jgi:hypothetical protein
MSETQQLEHYLLGLCDPEEKLLIDAQLLLHKDLREKIQWQQQTYKLVRDYGRKQLRAEIDAVHHMLFTEKKFESFRQKISSIFRS